MRKTNIYWLVVFLLIAVQALFTLNSLNQIRYEELVDSVTNPYWVQNGYVFTGGASNVGWYSLVLISYNLFGFDLFLAKYMKLVLYAVSVICLALLLKKYLGGKKAFVPLLTLGLSPTWLYFNTLNNTYGVDLIYLPICLFVLFGVEFKSVVLNFLRHNFFWFLSVFACLSYPTFLFYIPSLLILYIHKINQSRLSMKSKLMSYFTSAVSFFSPIFLIFIYFKNSELLINDPIEGGGLFRGGGVLTFDPVNFVRNLILNIYYLFYRGGGYYYELKKIEFSNIYPAASIFLVFILTFKLFNFNKFRLSLISAVLVLFLNIFFGNMSPDILPGLRRHTPILVSIYGLFILIWYIFTDFAYKRKSVLIYLAILLLLPAHHIISYPINLMHLKDKSIFAETVWFGQKETPQLSLNTFLDKVQKEDLYLTCPADPANKLYCRYSELYSAISFSCQFKNLDCHDIYGFSYKHNKFLKLSLDIWNNYQLKH